MNPSAPRLLMVSADAGETQRLTAELREARFETVVVHDLPRASRLLGSWPADVILVDWSACRDQPSVEIRAEARQPNGAPPTILLTDVDDDRVLGLDLGFADFVLKPWLALEVCSRIHAALRRAPPLPAPAVLQHRSIRVDLVQMQVVCNDNAITLTRRQFEILRIFVQHPGEVFSREDILEKIWPRQVTVEARTIDVHIRRLRKALADSGGDDVIKMKYGKGYYIE